MGWKWDDGLIVVDTREQEPYWPVAQRVTLQTGDYSVAGYEGVIAVERKSAADLLGSLGGRGGHRRDRLLRAFRRLSLMPRPAVVVESTPAGLYKARRFGRVTPAHAIGAMISWSSAYRVPVFFADDRTTAKSLVKGFLRLSTEGIVTGKHTKPECPCGGGGPVGHDERWHRE